FAPRTHSCYIDRLSFPILFYIAAIVWPRGRRGVRMSSKQYEEGIMRWTFLLAIGAAVACSAINASAEPRSVVDPANLRSGPGLAWPIIGVVPADTSVEILTCAQGNTTGWCKVKFDDTVGYVAASVLAPQGSSGVM